MKQALLTLFLLPGRTFTWWQYMFPKAGDVHASARRADSKGVHIIFSAVFWALLLVLLVTQTGLKDKLTTLRSNNGSPFPTEDIRPFTESEDWNAIEKTLGAAYALGPDVERFTWKNKSNGRSGQITQAGKGEDANGCRQFRVTRQDKSGEPEVTHIEYCRDGSYH